jgi:hypothetical protein
MYYQTESNLRNFNAWCGGNYWKQVVLNSSEDVIEYVDSLLDDYFPEDSHATETDINEFLWFDLAGHMTENGYTYDSHTDSFIENKED